MPKIIQMIGKKFGRLTVTEECEERTKDHRKLYKCQCECGNVIVCQGKLLRNGHTKSCGCLSHEVSRYRFRTHGKSETRLYTIFQGMKQRCFYNKNSHYKNYGERGIKICDEWLNDFMNFYNWAMSNGYKDNLTIDRIDVYGNYEPFNCRWVDVETQSNNKQNTIKLQYDKFNYSIAQWSKILNIPYQTLISRYYKGVDTVDLLTKRGDKTLYPYQVDVLADLYQHKSAGIFYDMGL